MPKLNDSPQTGYSPVLSENTNLAVRKVTQGGLEAVRFVYNHRHESLWQEPLLTAFATLNNATDFIRTAILANGSEAKSLGCQPSRFEDVLHRDFLFAARCVAEGAVIDDQLASLIEEQLIDWWFDPAMHTVFGRAIIKWQYFEWISDAVRFLFVSFRGTPTGKRLCARAAQKLSADDLPQTYRALEALELLDEDVSLPVLELYLRLWRSTDLARRQVAESYFESDSRKKRLVPSLLIALDSGDVEARRDAAILLAETGETTPAAIGILFEGIAKEDVPEEPENNNWQLSDWLSRQRQEEEARIRKERQARALSALLKIEGTARPDQIESVLVALHSVIEETERAIREAIASRADETTMGSLRYGLHSGTYQFDQVRLTAAYLLAKLGQSQGLVILQSAIVNPMSREFVYSAISKVRDLGTLTEDDKRQLERIAMTDAQQSALFAARRLSSLRQISDEVVTKVLEWTKDENSQIQSRAIDLLKNLQSQQPRVYDQLMNFVDREIGSDQENRCDVERLMENASEALYELGEIPAEHLPKILQMVRQPALSKEGEIVRWWGVKILAEQKIAMPVASHGGIVQTVLPLFDSETPDSSLLEKAEEVLGYLAISPSALPLMLDALRSDHERSRDGADWAMTRHLGQGRRIAVPGQPPSDFFFKLDLPDESVQILLDALKDPNPRVRQIAGIFLSQSNTKSAELVEGLTNLMLHAEPDVSMEAIDVLLDLGEKNEDVAEACLRLFGDSNLNVRSEAVRHLTRLYKSPKVTKAILGSALSDPHPEIRAECIRALPEVCEPGPEVKAAVLQAINEGGEARSTAIYALDAKIWTAEIQAELLKLLSDSDHPLPGRSETLQRTAELSEIRRPPPADDLPLWLRQLHHDSEQMPPADRPENPPAQQEPEGAPVWLRRAAETPRPLPAMPEPLPESSAAGDTESHDGEMHRITIEKIGWEGILDRDTISALLRLMHQGAADLQSAACEALGELLYRFQEGYSAEREEVASLLYDMAKRDRNSPAWGALWKIAPTLGNV